MQLKTLFLLGLSTVVSLAAPTELGRDITPVDLPTLQGRAGTCPSNYVNYDKNAHPNRGSSYVDDCNYIAALYKRDSTGKITLPGLPKNYPFVLPNSYSYAWGACKAYAVSFGGPVTMKSSTFGYSQTPLYRTRLFRNSRYSGLGGPDLKNLVAYIGFPVIMVYRIELITLLYVFRYKTDIKNYLKSISF